MTTRKSQSGQSLIETIIALYILVMALVAGLGLAIYSTSASVKSKDQIIASNLAREGLEVVRMFRDSNWLSAATAPSTLPFTSQAGGCQYGSGNGASTRRPCYPDAFASPYALPTSSNANNYIVRMDFSTAIGWQLDVVNGQQNYFLCLQNESVNPGTYQHRRQGQSGDVVCNDPTIAKFARRVTISTGSTSAPYTGDSNNPSANSGHSPEKIITSTVVWQGKQCAPFPTTNITNFDPVTFVTKCKLQMRESLSNWKDYE